MSEVATALLEVLRAVKLAEPSLGVKPLVAKLREQHPDLAAGAKEVRQALRTLEAAGAKEASPAAENAPSAAPSNQLPAVPRRANAGWSEAWKNASRDGDVASLHRMITAGQPLDAQNDCGFTALHVAAANEQPEAVRTLLRAGADASLRSLESHPVAHFASLTPLQLAQWHRRTAVVPLLAARSGEVPDVTGRGIEATRAKLMTDLDAEDAQKAQDVRQADQVIMHPFEWRNAATAGDVASLRRQLSQGQSVNQRNICGLTALHLAAKDGNEAAVEFLLNQGADATLRTHPGEALPNMTPLEMSQDPRANSKPAGGRVVKLLRAAERPRPT